ncbi:MAG: 5'-deoxynucleotidase [Clostridia bacterium]|nr:5'-deoxynucleotidase [Clostridia bacterium]
MENGFFAMISRMKYINRWALMRNEHSENLAEHSFEVAVIAHALTVIANERFGKNLNCERAAFLGLYHDAPETLTGDMPTPVKYYSDEVRRAYKTVEDVACESLVGMLPDEMKSSFRPAFIHEEQDAELWKYIKAADKISAYIKCMEEKKAGNSEFILAGESTAKAIKALNLPEADIFVKEFLPAYELTLDELKS